MNASLTLACLIAAGVGLVVQNTLMVRITQSASTILIAMLLNSLVGIVIFVTMLLLRQGVAGFHEREVVDADPRPAGVLFRLRQHQRLSKRWRGDDHCGTGGQPAGGRVDHGFSSRPRRAGAGADRTVMRGGDAGGGRLAGGQTPVLSASSEDRAAFGQLLAARVLLFLMLSPMMGDGGAQTLLLDIAFLTTELRIITQGD